MKVATARVIYFLDLVFVFVFDFFVGERMIKSY